MGHPTNQTLAIIFITIPIYVDTFMMFAYQLRSRIVRVRKAGNRILLSSYYLIHERFLLFLFLCALLTL